MSRPAHSTDLAVVAASLVVAILASGCTAGSNGSTGPTATRGASLAAATEPAPGPTVASTPTPSPTITPSPIPPGPTPDPNAPLSAVKLQLVAKGIAWNVTTLKAPAGHRFTVILTNKDTEAHNLVLQVGPNPDLSGARLFTDPPMSGPASESLVLPGLPPGDYIFFCSIHPEMLGQLTIK